MERIKRTVAYIGNFEPPYSTENDVREAFELLGHEVIKLQENSTNINQIRDAANRADLLLLTGTWDSLPLAEMLDIFYEMADRGKPTATLHLDTFWPTQRGGRLWWREAMFHSAYIFTADGDWPDKWAALGKQHIWLPPGVRNSAVKPGVFREEYACDLAFVGSNGRGYHEDVWPYRRELVDQLRSMARRNGWSFKNPGGDDPKVDRGDDMNDFYASAKVTVGDSLCVKREDSWYWSDRVPEATGRHGLLIMPQINALERFHPGVPMYQWGDWNDLESKIRQYQDDKINTKARDQAFESTKNAHTYSHNVNFLLAEVGLL